jgi:acetyltransferase
MKPDTDFDRLFAPSAVAVVGASDNRSRIGGQPLYALTEFGFAGGIYPVNPKYAHLAGWRCYASLAEIPAPCDVAILALPASAVPAAVMQCGDARIPFAIVFSAGFAEIGAKGASLQLELQRAVHESGVRVIGPNCLGTIGVASRAYCGFGSIFQNEPLLPGSVAMVSQSGGFGYSVVGLAYAAGMRFSHVASTGNEVDVTALDLVEYFLQRPDVQQVVAYLEGVQDGRRLIECGQRALRSGKPILVYKVGNSASGRTAALSHTARLTGDYDLYRAAFQSGGFVELRDVSDLVAISSAFTSGRRPTGTAIGVVTASGGAGVMVADRLEEAGMPLPDLSLATTTELVEALPDYASAANPVDMTGQVLNDAGLFRRALECVARDAGIDQLVVCNAAIQGDRASAIAKVIVQIAQQFKKPVFVVWSAMPGKADEALSHLAAAAIPCFATPTLAVLAIAALNVFEERRRVTSIRTSSMHAIPSVELPLPRDALVLNEHESKLCFAAYGISVANERLLSFADIESLRSAPFPPPYVAKLCSRQIPHKTELQLVHVKLEGLEQLARAAADLALKASQLPPEVQIDGVLVQEFLGGVEMLVGCRNDSCFGPVVVLGYGGIHAELIDDVVCRFAPIDVAEAHRMIDELKCRKLFDGYRSKTRLSKTSLAELISRSSMLIADNVDLIAEIDMNPVFVSESSAVVADGLLVLRSKSVEGPGTAHEQRSQSMTARCSAMNDTNPRR